MSSTAILDGTPNFKVGCDPEMFITKDGVPVSAEGIIPGTKAEPFKVKKGAVHVDGMAAEINIDPADNFQDFNGNISAVMSALTKMLPKGHALSIVPAVTFDPEVFEAAPETAKELGCQPDFNAWTGEVNPPPKDPDNPCLRTASGHIHIGWGDGFELSDAQHMLNCRDLVRQLDWYLGAYSVSIDTDATRRRLYGRAGAFRPKPYGVEYRVLSNYWLTSKERRIAVWNRLHLAIRDMRSQHLPELADKWNDIVIDQINESKVNPSLVQSFRYPVQTTDTAYRTRLATPKRIYN